MTIVLTGGSGFIGIQLAHTLLALGDTVVVVDIVAPNFTHERLYFIKCNITTSQLPFNVLEQTDAVINLVGTQIAHKWNTAYKKSIRESRIISTRHIVESMRTTTNRPTILINASAVGYYGERGAEELTEKSVKGDGFLADVVADWETEAQKAEDFGVRVVCIRTATVVGHGGMIFQLRKSARFGFLWMFSKRDFWQPWIHEKDIVNVYLFALQTSTLQGVVNAVAPESVTHTVFMKSLSRVLKRRIIGVVPIFIQKILFGTLLDEITKSQHVLPQRILDKGFIFTYPSLQSALIDVIKKNETK